MVVFGIMVKKKWCMGIGGGVLNLGSVSWVMVICLIGLEWDFIIVNW